MMYPYQRAIAELRRLDLSKTSYDEIVAHIRQVASVGFIKMELPAGMTIMRGRPDEGLFTNRCELSYKPQKFNTTYQRASTPNHTMFYGVVITDEEMANKPLHYPREVTAREASNIIRDKRDGVEPLTYSRWEIIKDVPVLVIAPHNDYLTDNPNTEQLRYFLQSFATSPEVDNQMTIEITNFLAEAFSKRVTSDDPHYEYKISAIVSEFFLSQAQGAIGGFYYPSVQANGGGYVVSITPDFVDANLKLTAAGRCRVYKKRGSHTIVDNEYACIINDDSQPFIMTPVDEELRVRPEEVSKLGYKRFEFN